MKTNNYKIPKYANFLFDLILPRIDCMYLKGDYEEIYSRIYSNRGRAIANFWIALQIIKSFPLYSFDSIYWSTAILKNYFKIAFRNIKRQKGYSFINISGLALGIASCILILSYVNYQLSFDKYHKNADRIYRIAAQGTLSGNDFNNAKISAPMASFLLNDYPETENIVRFSTVVFNLFRYKNEKYYESNFLYADNSIFNVFTYSLLRGDPDTALKLPYSIVLTQQTAYRYFGNEDPMGKIIKFNDSKDLTVTGIMRKPPVNSHLQFDALLSFETFIKDRPRAAQNRMSFSCYTYILLKDGIILKNFEKNLTDFFDRYMGDLLEAAGGKLSCLVQPLTSIHLYSNLENDIPGIVSIIYIYIFIVIATLILLIACINYINLATARSAKRAKEIGMRKVLGAFRCQIIREFIGESLIYGVLAFIFSMMLVLTMLPHFRSLTMCNVSINFLKEPLLLVELVLILFFVCFIAGGYPAFFLSGFKPVKTLKGIFTRSSKNSYFRNALVVFQFAISITLIIMTIGIISQLEYIKSRNLGFYKEQILSIKIHNDHSDNENRINWINLLKAELINLDGVVNASLCNYLPGFIFSGGDEYVPVGGPENQSIIMEYYPIDDGFLNTLGIDIIEGRGFSKEFLSDNNAVIINETAVKKFGWKNPIGKKIRQKYYSSEEYYVIGVVRDFYSRSLHHLIDPVIFYKNTDYHTLVIRFKPENITHTMKLIREKWNEFEPGYPFEYSFLEDRFDNLYKTEVQIGRIIQIFTLLAVFISCLGLFGLVSFITEQRTKEIGIRKTIGASTANISALLTKELTKWILLANLFAWPAAYFMINYWLRNFAYKISIGWEIFLISGSIAFLITFITVSHRVLKATYSNPVDSLRYE